ncbi:MAG: glycoside hydrolase family 30 beta sandwich domain-containing protein [Sphingomonas sp.]|jgi:glucosylceramidase
MLVFFRIGRWGGTIAAVFAAMAGVFAALVAPVPGAALPHRGAGRALAAQAAGNVDIWLTTADQRALLAQQASLRFGASPASGQSIIVDPAQRYQSMVGFGAAMTDASAFLINQRMTSAQRRALLRDLFDRPAGIGLNFMRLTLGSSDFSQAHYSYDDQPAGQRDPGLRHFSIAPARRDILPLARAVRRINPTIAIMATPWSPPGWMKTSDSLIRGSLRDGSAQDFAAYLRRSVLAFGQAGVPIDYLSLQNEPDFEPADYPGMRLSAAQRAWLIGAFVGPALQRSAPRTKILEWDHNWDKPDQPLLALADPVAARFISGVGWHCYAGDAEAQKLVHDLHPKKDSFFTECSGGEWAKPWPDSWPWLMQNVMIGATRNWARGILLWNLALDEHHGPHLGGCGNCRGVVTIDSQTGAVSRNPEYYALAHFSRFVLPGATRIESTAAIGTVRSVAFINPDNSRVLILFNNGEQDTPVSVQERGGRSFDYRLPPRAAATFRWRRAG